MKKLVLICALCFMCLMMVGVSFAGEKEEYQWRARALVAEANLLQIRLVEAQKTIQDFIKELDLKGFMVSQDGSIMEKPKKPIDKPTLPGGEK